MNKTRQRASRDLFSVSLDIDIISFKLKNIREDLEEAEGCLEELEALQSLALRVRDLQNRTGAIIRSWDNAKD